jgi:hypothetical protein
MSKRASKHPDPTPEPDAQRVAHAATGVVAAAEAALRDLEAQRAELLLRAAEHDAERKRIAFAAFSMSDAEASRRLSDMRDEAVRHDHELRDLDDAVTTAKERVADAQAALERVLDMHRQQDIAGELQKLVGIAKRLDEALSAFLAASREMIDVTASLQRLGRTHPNGEQINVLGWRALSTVLASSMWSNRFERLQPSARTSFTELATKWAAQASPGAHQPTDEVAA